MRNAGLRRSARLLATITTVALVLLSFAVTALMQDAGDPAARKWPRPAVSQSIPINLAPVPNSPEAQLILDGGFEAGFPHPDWPVQTSSNFGTPLCDVPSCTTGGGASPPRTGAFWAWFGGIPAPETATLGQTVTIPTGVTADLTFWMRIGTVSSPFSDVLNVRVDGAVVQAFPEPTVAEGAYTLRTINMNAFANGAAHTILFEYIGPSSGTGSYVVDDVELNTTVTDTAPSVSSTTPVSSAINQPRNTDLTITFDEAVNVAGNWFQIVCGSSGTRNVADTVVTGGPTTFTINPNADFANGEICTTTVFAAQVTDVDAADPPDNMASDFVFGFMTANPPPFTAEVEPNGTSATAQALPSTPVRVRGNLFPNGDIDFFSFIATAGDRVYAATMTSWSAGSSTDSQITLLDTDGTTVIEFDDDNGSFAGFSSSIAGATIPTTGTYFLKINDFTAGTTSERPYELYLRLQSGAPTPEVEGNDTPATANPLPVNGWVSGTRDPAAATEQDWFSLALNAGDTVYFALDVDPEDDLVVWNGRLGVALFGDATNQILVVDDGGAAETPNPLRPSEAMFMTVKTAGTYFAFVDSATAATGGPTATYHLSVTVYPAANEGVNCTTYTSTDVPKTIGPGTGLVSSTITVPGNPRIADVDVDIVLNHTVMNQIDAHLRSPAGNDNGLFTDIGASAAGGQAQMDVVFDDEAGIPPAFTVLKGIQIKPELNYRLAWLDGENAGGTWTLDLYDDVADANGGTLTAWSLRICEPPPVVACTTGIPVNLLVNTDFETGAAGFTHSGTADEWELGLPATVATTTANPVAGFTTCNSGVNCWKTDLDNTYGVSSSQDLLSPPIVLQVLTAPVTLSWAQKYQMESATFDHYFVEVREVGNPSNSKKVFEFLDATMTDPPGSPAVNVPASSGWSVVSADISQFLGKVVEVRFHVDSDTTINFAGVAIDDFTVTACTAPTAAPATISGKITTPDGQPLGGVTMNLSGARSAKVITDAGGNYRFRNIDTDNFYTVTPSLRNYHFGPESRSFSLLANMTDAVFTATRDAVISGNAIDTAEYFVRQHYLDFLGREPDESGFNFWSDQMLECGGDAECLERRRINVSAAYFLSIEFQQTGGLVDGFYRASYGRRPLFAEFMPDVGTIARDVIVGQPGWQQLLAMNKQSFVQAWVQRSAFRDAYDSLSNDSYVDTLISHTGVTFSQSERDALVSGLAGNTLTRAGALLRIVDDERFVSAKRNETFVMMEYFGYLRRDPDDSGFQFWLNKLNQFGGNFEQAEMVKAFINSGEYKDRFRQ